MPDFSPSGIAGLPGTTADSLVAAAKGAYDQRILGWVQEAIQEGDSINQADPAYDRIAKAMRYVASDQRPNPGEAVPRFLEPMMLNVSRKAVQAHVSALTDLEPTFGWKSSNPKYQFQADLLNQIIIAWWVSQMADVDLGDVITYALAAGTADMLVEWDTTLPFGGDHVILPRDVRDTLPIRPGRRRSPQTWQGVVFRETWTINALLQKYPLLAPRLSASQDSWLSSVKGLFTRRTPDFTTPADPLSALNQAPRSGPVRSGDVFFWRCYLTDQTRNTTGRPLPMGAPGSNWAYVVKPNDLLYPRKRLIFGTDNLVIYDGPNPYWHGRYPFARLKLWSLPWHFLGLSLLHDTMSVQNAINKAYDDQRLGIEKWLDPAVVLDTTGMSENLIKAWSQRKPGGKLKLKGTAVDVNKVIKVLDGPNPTVLQQNFELMTRLEERFEHLMGTANLTQLMQLRQMPGADTIQKYFEALTPEIRYEARQVESFLRDASTLVCYNTFQFYSAPRRITILGDAALALEDFDYDPGNLVPAMQATQMTPQGIVPTPDYDPAFDANRSRDERAQAMAKLMIFVVKPNSLMAMHSTEKKMEAIQLSRQGYLDFWSLGEILGIPNIGTPPPIPLPPLQPPTTPEEALLGLAEGRYILDPTAPMPMPIPGMPPPIPRVLEFRVPMTVTERLLAQNLLGIGMTENPAGRKASGQAEPKMESKDGGSRQTMTESRK